MRQVFVGLDWAENHHDVLVEDDTGKRLGGGRLPEGVEGVARFHELVADHVDNPADVVVATETDRGLFIGTLVAAARISPVPVLRGAAWAYTQFFVNVPLLALLILAVFALPDAGLIMPLAPTTVLVLALYEAAYVAEAVRSGVNTVGNGQIEASRALGLTLGQTLRLVVLPQSLPS